MLKIVVTFFGGRWKFWTSSSTEGRWGDSSWRFGNQMELLARRIGTCPPRPSLQGPGRICRNNVYWGMAEAKKKQPCQNALVDFCSIFIMDNLPVPGTCLEKVSRCPWKGGRISRQQNYPKGWVYSDLFRKGEAFSYLYTRTCRCMFLCVFQYVIHSHICMHMYVCVCIHIYMYMSIIVYYTDVLRCDFGVYTTCT